MPTVSYQDGLIKSLIDAQEAALYINASLQETLIDGDWEAFLIALNNVCKAKELAGFGSVPQELNDLKVTEGGVDLGTLSRILAHVGIAIEFKPTDEPLTAA